VSRYRSPAAVASFFDLLALEAHRAGMALLWIVALGTAAALCAVSAWLGFMAALAIWAVSLGFPLEYAVAVLAMLNLLAGFLLIRYCVSLGRSLLFPATRRQLTGEPAVTPGTLSGEHLPATTGSPTGPASLP